MMWREAVEEKNDSEAHSPEIAFLYSDGKMYYGENHVELMQQADLADQWGSATRWQEPHGMVLGWIWNNKDGTQTAEFYSDFYQFAQDSDQFDEIYKELKKQFPKLQSLSFGPDKDTWEEMQKEPDWMEQYLPEKTAAGFSGEQIVREIVNFAATGERPDEETLQRMTDEAHKIRHLSSDRMRMELDDLLGSERPSEALKLADECGLLDYLVPELGASYDFNQNNRYHSFSLGDHSLAVLKEVQRINQDPDVRLAALLHDVGKPDTYWEDPFGNGHFYAKPGDDNAQDHEARGADMAQEFMQRLGYPQERIDKVDNLIRNHMWNFYSTNAGARRFINRAGSPEAANNLFDLKQGDIVGKGATPDQDQLAQLEMSRALYQKQLQEGSDDSAAA